MYYKFFENVRTSWSGTALTHFSCNEKIPSPNLGFSYHICTLSCFCLSQISQTQP